MLVGSKRRIVQIFAMMGSMLVAGSALGQSIQPVDSGMGGANSISGTVLSPSGQRIQKPVAVRLATMTKGDRVAVTDSSGNFAFSRLINGDYTLLVDKEAEYELFTMSVNVFQMRGMPGQNFLVSIRLKAKAANLAKPSVVSADLAGVPKAAVEYFNKGVELATAGDRKGAIEQLGKAVSEHPNFMLAHNEIGVQYMRLNELAKADEALQTALKIEPEAYTPLVNRGIVLFMLKRYADAEPVLRTAVKVNTEPAVAHYFLGQALAHLGKFVDGEKELTTAVKTGGPEMKEAHRLLAIIYAASGDNAGAIEALETYLKLAPRVKDAEQLREKIAQLKKLPARGPKPDIKP